MKLKLFSALLLGMSMVSHASDTKPGIKFTEYTLPNGLHVILHEDHATPIVTVSVMYHVGSKNEDPERTGFAHFLEHLLFEGSEHIGRGEYMKLVQANGGQLNANTSQDRTYYYQTMPSNQLELALWMESERMLHAKIDSVGVETQRKVVKEEKKQRYDNTPYGQIMNVVFENHYTVHPYSWTPIGKEQYIDLATLNEFVDFYKTYYVPENAVLVISGDIQLKKTRKLVEKYYAGIPRGKKPVVHPEVREPAQTAEKRVTFHDNIQLPAVVVSHHAAAMGTDDSYAIQLLSQLLSKGKSSRLRSELTDKTQQALEVASFTTGNADPGLFIILAIANAGVEVSELETALIAEIERVKNGEITDAEFNKLINQAENDFISQNQNIEGLSENLATYHTFLGNASLINTELERYRKVTPADLQRVARKYFTSENRLVVHYLPHTESSKSN